MIEPDELQRIIDEEWSQADKPGKSMRELAREYSYIPGIRMMAAREAEGHQLVAEAAQYVNPNSVHLPTGRPRERSVL